MVNYWFLPCDAANQRVRGALTKVCDQPSRSTRGLAFHVANVELA